MQAATSLETVEDLTPGLIKKLESAGITTVEQLADLAPEDLEAVPGIGGKTIDRIRDALSEYYANLPSYQSEMERVAQERMFSKSSDDFFGKEPKAEDNIVREGDVETTEEARTKHPLESAETTTVAEEPAAETALAEAKEGEDA